MPEKERKHVALLVDPDGFDRFEETTVDDGVTVTKAFKGDADSIPQAVVFEATKFDEPSVEKWLKDHQMKAISIDIADPDEPAQPEEEPPVVEAPGEVVEEDTVIQQEEEPCEDDKKFVAACQAEIDAAKETIQAWLERDGFKLVQEVAHKRENKVIAAKAVAALCKPILAYDRNQPRDKGGQFAEKGGGSSRSRRNDVSDRGASALRNAAAGASDAANEGVGSHKTAAQAHAVAAEKLKEVERRSTMEMAAALQRGDRLSADAHSQEREKAAKLRVKHEERAYEHATTQDAPPGGFGPEKGILTKSAKGKIRQAASAVGRFALRSAGKTAMLSGAGLAGAGIASGVGAAPLGAAGAALAIGGYALNRAGKKLPTAKITPTAGYSFGSGGGGGTSVTQQEQRTRVSMPTPPGTPPGNWSNPSTGVPRPTVSPASSTPLGSSRNPYQAEVVTPRSAAATVANYASQQASAAPTPKYTGSTPPPRFNRTSVRPPPMPAARENITLPPDLPPRKKQSSFTPPPSGGRQSPIVDEYGTPFPAATPPAMPSRTASVPSPSPSTTTVIPSTGTETVDRPKAWKGYGAAPGASTPSTPRPRYSSQYAGESRRPGPHSRLYPDPRDLGVYSSDAALVTKAILAARAKSTEGSSVPGPPSTHQKAPPKHHVPGNKDKAKAWTGVAGAVGRPPWSGGDPYTLDEGEWQKYHKYRMGDAAYNETRRQYFSGDYKGEQIHLATQAILAAHAKTLEPIEASEPATGDIIAMASSVNIEAAEMGSSAPRFTISPAYNGGPLTVGKYDLPVIVDLEGLSVNPQSVQACLFHEEQKLVGHVDSVMNDKSSLSLSGPCSGLGSVVSEFLDSARNKFPWKASIEARPLEKPELIPAGQQVHVNGQTFDGPLFIARRAELYGVSFVPRGADDRTVVSIAARAANTPLPEGEIIMAALTFEEWADAVGVTEDDLKQNPEMKGRLTASYKFAMRAMEEDEQQAPPEEELPVESEDPLPPEEEEDEQVESEEAGPPWDEKKKEKEEMEARQKFDLDVIRAGFDDSRDEFEVLCAQYEDSDTLERKKLRAIQAGWKKSARDLKQKAIKARWLGPLYKAECEKIHAKAELELVRAERPKGPMIMTPKSQDTGMTNDILACAVMKAGRYEKRSLGFDIKAGADRVRIEERVEDIFPEPVLEATDKKFRRGIGLQELLIEAAQMNGWDGRSFKSDPHGCMRAAFEPIKASDVSTANISGILSNVANKFLLEGFFFVEQAWKEISGIRSVNDFKTVTSYRLTGGGEFLKVPAGGEIKHGTLGEESYTNKADTYGLMLGITRTDIINDDLGAITTVPRVLGKGAGKALNKIFWTEFLGGISTLFVDDHGTPDNDNYMSGASSALSITSLTTAEQLFMDLKDSDSDPIGHMPAIMLVPTSLSATSAQLFHDTEIRNTTASTVYTTGNPHQGKFRPVVSRYIANSGYTGYTSTGWGIFADPKDVPVIEMAFLFGNEAPTVEQADADFNMLGIQMRGFFDFGCNTQDYRGGVWSAGA